MYIVCIETKIGGQCSCLHSDKRVAIFSFHESNNLTYTAVTENTFSIRSLKIYLAHYIGQKSIQKNTHADSLGEPKTRTHKCYIYNCRLS